GVFRLLQFVRILPKDFRTVELETEFNNGCHIGTISSHPLGSAITNPPQIVAEWLPRNTPVQQIIARHMEKVNDYLAMYEGLEPVRIRTVEDLNALQVRQRRLKNAYRASVGYITPEEMRKM